MDFSKAIFKSFKSRCGVSLSTAATSYLNTVLKSEEFPEEALDVITASIKDRIDKRILKSSVVDADVIASVVAELSSSTEDLEKEKFQLLDAFHMPKIEYDEQQKVFKLNKKPKLTMIGNVHSRAAMYRERLAITTTRLIRSNIFTTSKLSSKTAATTSTTTTTKHEIATIASLLGTSDQKVLFGFLTQLEEGVWYLEDLLSTIRLDFTLYQQQQQQQQQQQSFFTEGCQVILQGTMVQGIFLVELMGHPPAEEREETMQAYRIDDIFSTTTTSSSSSSSSTATTTTTTSNNYLNMLELESAAVDTMIVILSDVQLDKPMMMENLEKLFRGFESTNSNNIMFILCGDFLSQQAQQQQQTAVANNNTQQQQSSSSSSSSQQQQYQLYFQQLINIINNNKNLCENGRFLFVPSNNDSGGLCHQILPRKPLFIPNINNNNNNNNNSDDNNNHGNNNNNNNGNGSNNPAAASATTATAWKKIKHVAFTTNPSRLRFYTQEIVLFRSNLMKKFQRLSLFQPFQQDTSKKHNNNKGNNKDNKMVIDVNEEDDDEEAVVVDMATKLANTIVQQQHLSPLPSSAQPVHWEYDHCLRLSPLPHLLVLADRTDQYLREVKGCLVVNPGSFATDFSFVVYRPATRRVEFSSIQ